MLAATSAMLSDLHVTRPVMQALLHLWHTDYRLQRFVDAATLRKNPTMSLADFSSLIQEHCDRTYFWVAMHSQPVICAQACFLYSPILPPTAQWAAKRLFTAG